LSLSRENMLVSPAFYVGYLGLQYANLQSYKKNWVHVLSRVLSVHIPVSKFRFIKGQGSFEICMLGT